LIDGGSSPPPVPGARLPHTSHRSGAAACPRAVRMPVVSGINPILDDFLITYIVNKGFLF
jgi:hypothetical protein